MFKCCIGDFGWGLKMSSPRREALAYHLLKTRSFKELLDTIANWQTPNTLLLNGSRKMIENLIVEKALGTASIGTFLSGYGEEAAGIELVNPLDTRKMRVLFTDEYPLDAYLFDAVGNMLSNPFYFDGLDFVFEVRVDLSGEDLFNVGLGTFDTVRMRGMEARNQYAYWKTNNIVDSFWRFQTLYGGVQTCAELVCLGANNGAFRIQRAGNISLLSNKILDTINGVLRLPNTQPATPQAGDTRYDPATDLFEIYDGAVWRPH